MDPTICGLMKQVLAVHPRAAEEDTTILVSICAVGISVSVGVSFRTTKIVVVQMMFKMVLACQGFGLPRKPCLKPVVGILVIIIGAVMPPTAFWALIAPCTQAFGVDACNLNGLNP